MKVLEGLRAKKTHRQIAVDIFGVREVKAKWYTDGGMRSQVRQWIAKAKAHGRGRLARPRARLRWSWFLGQEGGGVKVYPGNRSCRHTFWDSSLRTIVFDAGADERQKTAPRAIVGLLLLAGSGLEARGESRRGYAAMTDGPPLASGLEPGTRLARSFHDANRIKAGSAPAGRGSRRCASSR